MTRRLIALPLLVLLLAHAPAAGQDDDGVKARTGKFLVEERGYFRRLVNTEIDTLFGTQINEPYIVRADAPNLFGVGTQWEVLAVTGAVARWDPTHEPITYYHRTGPVGALFYHLRTRKVGADAAAPVGVVGLFAGTPAAYAVRGQTLTFYNAQPDLKGLVAESDTHFTFLRDARRRGATVEVRHGPAREALAADTGKRYAALLVEMVEESFDPGDRLTLEAVRLYLDRVTPDGIVALHTSNRVFKMEPATERIARELKLAARVWDDDSENRPGKTASSWVVLARSEDALGPLARPLRDQVMSFGTRSPELTALLRKYPASGNAMDAILEQYGGPPRFWPGLTPSTVSIRQGPQAAILFQHAIRLRDAGQGNADLARLTELVYRSMFRPLLADPAAELRTDANRPPLPRLPPPAKK